MDIEHDAVFKAYQNYTSNQAKKVTRLPVYLDANPNADSKNSSAHILKYNYPPRYKIVFSGGFYRYHKNDTYMIKQIISHELAHILEPHDHDAGFKQVAKKLGCKGRYLNER